MKDDEAKVLLHKENSEVISSLPHSLHDRPTHNTKKTDLSRYSKLNRSYVSELQANQDFDFKEFQNQLRSNNKEGEYFDWDRDCDMPLLDQMHTYSGYGQFQLQHFISSGLIFFTEGFYLTLIPSTVIPLKEYFGISDLGICVMNILMFVFLAIGNILISHLTVKYTRRQIMFIAFLIMLPCAIVMITSKMVEVFTAAYVLVGLSLGLVVPIMVNSMTEVTPIYLRAFTVTFVWIFFTLAQFMTPYLLSVFMPSLESENMSIVLTIGIIATCVAFTISIIIYQETPRHLLYVKRNEEAFEGLEKLLSKKLTEEAKQQLIISNDFNRKKDSMNEGQNEADHMNPIKEENSIEGSGSGSEAKQEESDNQKNESLEQREIKEENIKSRDESDNQKEKEKFDMQEEIKPPMAKSGLDECIDLVNGNTNEGKNLNRSPASDESSKFSKLFSDDYLKITIISSILWLINAMIFYGPSLILTVTIEKLSRIYNLREQATELDIAKSANADVVNSLYYYALAAGISLSFSSCLAEIKFFGRRGSMICAYALGAVSGTFMIIFPNKFIIFFLVMSFFTTIGYNIMGSYTSELFSTDVRDTAMGFFFFTNRIGAVVSQFLFLQLFKINISIPYIILCLLSLIGSICSCLFPYDTLGKSLDVIK
mmetsp:Transcript_18829/g.19508  ORF Transcript_18829/g.19508 Transcript_18829/m.19508 type:complete len:653 (+) Transcript_18829:32-1990(+)